MLACFVASCLVDVYARVLNLVGVWLFYLVLIADWFGCFVLICGLLLCFLLVMVVAGLVVFWRDCFAVLCCFGYGLWFTIAGLLVGSTDLGLHYFVFSYVLLILFTVVGCLVWCVVCCGLAVMRWLVRIVVWLGLCYCLDFVWFVGG